MIATFSWPVHLLMDRWTTCNNKTKDNRRQAFCKGKEDQEMEGGVERKEKRTKRMEMHPTHSPCPPKECGCCVLKHRLRKAKFCLIFLNTKDHVSSLLESPQWPCVTSGMSFILGVISKTPGPGPRSPHPDPHSTPKASHVLAALGGPLPLPGSSPA